MPWKQMLAYIPSRNDTTTIAATANPSPASTAYGWGCELELRRTAA